jgi:hypothetical protein
MYIDSKMAMMEFGISYDPLSLEYICSFAFWAPNEDDIDVAIVRVGLSTMTDLDEPYTSLAAIANAVRKRLPPATTEGSQ